MSEVRQPEIGQAVVFTDAHGMGHPALLTAVHGTASQGYQPSVNLVFVTDDATKKDPYGHQIERHSCRASDFAGCPRHVLAVQRSGLNVASRSSRHR